MGLFARSRPGVILGLIALVVATAGTAVGATKLIDGKSIKNHSIPASKLTHRALTSLRGTTRHKGDTGAKGDPGVPGSAGPGAVPFSYADTSLPDVTSAPPYQTIATVGPIVLKAYCFHNTTNDQTIIRLAAFSTGPQFDLDAFYENQSNGAGAYTTNSADTAAPISEGVIDYFPVDSKTTERTFISPALISYPTASGKAVDTVEGVAYQDGRPGTRRCSFVGSVTPAIAD